VLFLLSDLALVAVLLALMLGAQEIGRRIGDAENKGRKEGEKSAAGPAEGAVYAVLGLLLAFTFSGAGSRYEHRYDLGVEEANAIGTAWLRIDALPADRQPHVRDLFRQYADARIASLGHDTNPAVHEQTMQNVVAAQGRLWSAAVEALRASGQPPLYAAVMSPINDMIDITTTRDAAARLHPPIEVFVVLFVFVVVGAMFAGHARAGKPRSWIHGLGFPLVLALVLFAIIDFEFPRFGFIRVDAVDRLLVDVRRSMD
jgi:hypothetical protein